MKPYFTNARAHCQPRIAASTSRTKDLVSSLWGAELSRHFMCIALPTKSIRARGCVASTSWENGVFWRVLFCSPTPNICSFNSSFSKKIDRETKIEQLKLKAFLNYLVHHTHINVPKNHSTCTQCPSVHVHADFEWNCCWAVHATSACGGIG